MISCPSIEKRVIRSHYDLATPFYRLFWGRHIHHGLWEGTESPAEAQLKLTDTVIREAGLERQKKGPRTRLLDVGCGMGGSAIHLAKEWNCDVTGITLSPVQRRWASMSARWSGASPNARFLVADAETVDFEPQSFDLVWSLECTEHLFDKAAFFRRAAGWLKPGGRAAICAWQAADGTLSDDAKQQCYDVCEGFLCPSLGSGEDYRSWFVGAGLEVERSFDWTNRVAQTWEICSRRVERSRIHWLARLVDRNQLLFLNRFQTILRAYRSGAMTYGCWIARKPA
jgi:tocopherol O-methyltransferase